MDHLRFAGRWAKRLPIRMAFAAAMPSWRRSPAAPEASADRGYTALIGCKHEVVPILHATLAMLDQAPSQRLHEVIVVFDRTETPELRAEIAAAVQRHPRLAIRSLFYSPRQYWIAQRFKLPWMYCCLNWAIGLDAATSDTVLLHDLDAMILDPSVFDDRYDRFRARGLQWLGDSVRVGRGPVESDGYAATWEMFLDRDHVVSNHRPVGLFNKMAIIDGRVIDFDITIYAQHMGGRRAVEPLGEAVFVHPSQVIHQYTEMQRMGVLEPLPGMMILFALYFMHLGGSSQPMLTFTEASAAAPVTEVPFVDAAINCSAMTGDFVARLRGEVARLERHLHTETRPEVEDFLKAVEALLDR